MNLIWTSIKQAGADLWEELLYLILFNLIWVVGTLLVIPWPFVTFGLFLVMYDVGQGKGIKFDTFFRQAAKLWKQAYVWGLVNLGLMVILWVNMNFYAALETQWARMVQIFFLGSGLAWLIVQTVVLALYPRLEQPGLRPTLRYALALLGGYPALIVTLLLFLLLVGAILLYAPVLVIFCGAAVVAAVTNRLVGNTIALELAKDDTAPN